MVSDKFYFHGGNGRNGSRLPGKNEWKIFNTSNNDTSSSSEREGSRSNRPQDDWLHIGRSDIQCKHPSYGSYSSSSSQRSTKPSIANIKIPSNNEFLVQHKRAWKLEAQNKENKTRFPKTTLGIETGFGNHGNRNDRSSNSRSNNRNTSSSSTSRNNTSTSHLKHLSYNSAHPSYHSGREDRGRDDDVLSDWTAVMDL